MLRPESVEQLVQVLVRFRYNYITRGYDVDKAHKEALREVAERWQITTNTVQDMCFRRFGLPGISTFRDLLREWVSGNPKPLFGLLKKFTPSSFHVEIGGVLEKGESNMVSSSFDRQSSFEKVPQRLENFSCPLDPEIAKSLKILSLLENVSPSDFLKVRVADVVKKEYGQWLNQQKSDRG